MYGISESETVATKDSFFFGRLHEEIEKTCTSRDLILLGDFNNLTGNSPKRNIVELFGKEVKK